MAMTSRERINAALNHTEPDQIPVDLGSTIVTSICKGAYLDLMDHLGLEIKEEDVEIMDVVQQLPYLDQRLLDWVQVDAVPLITNPPSTWELKIKEEGNYYTFIDQWGAKLYRPKNGYYYDYREFPIKESTLKALEKMDWPDPNDPARMKGIKEKAIDLYENTEYAIVGSPLFGGGIFEHPARIRGMEEFLMSTASNLKFAEAIMEKMTQLYIKATDNFLEEVGKYIDVYAYWDDVGMQNGPMIRPSFYKKYIKPRQKRLFDLIHKKSEAKIFLHTCGASSKFISDFIDIGVDILNPIQVSAKGMATAELKKEYGRDITFWGGGVNSQKILPFGSKKEVSEEVKRRVDDLASGGGFVFASVHNIQNFVPPENITEMFNTLKKCWEY